jgi:hypothetical protein
VQIGLAQEREGEGEGERERERERVQQYATGEAEIGKRSVNRRSAPLKERIPAENCVNRLSAARILRGYPGIEWKGWGITNTSGVTDEAQVYTRANRVR